MAQNINLESKSITRKRKLDRRADPNQPDPTDVTMVDLQGARLGRLGVELAYFLCSSTSPKQRREHFDELLHYYYDRFEN
jgi:hypothetical protein